MKKNKVIASTFITLLAVSALGSITANAASFNTTSEGKIRFTDAPALPGTPYDPTDPNFPPREVDGDPDDPSKPGNGTTGALRFERVPNFDFGEIAIDVNGMKDIPVKDEKFTYKDSPKESYYSAPTIEVTDGRGDAPGWHVNVRSSGEFKASDPSIPSFNGKIKLNQGTAASYTKGVALADAPTINNNFVINSAYDVLINAPETKGNAKWGISYYDTADATAITTSTDGIVRPAKRTTQGTSKAITLEISPGQKISKDTNYTTVIEWELVDEPKK